MAYARGTPSRMGRRIDSATAQRNGYRVSQQGHRVAGQKRGKREKLSSKRERRQLFQLIISAALLIAVIGVKLAAPDTLDQYRDKLLGWMNRDTDFVAAFSAVGKAIGDGGITDALGEAYQEVFGASEEDNVEQTGQETESPPEDSGEMGQAAPEQETEPTRVAYTVENLPEDVCMIQQVLGFSYANPVQGMLSSCFGYREDPVEGNEKFHYGLDIAADEGTVINAFAAGIVTAVGESSELGKYVMVAHEGGYTTLYAHCSRITASSGQTVKCEDPIAEVGQTGQATGPHLHFELHQNTTYLNPIYYVSL